VDIHSRLCWISGFLLALVSLSGLADRYLLLAPPSDLYVYLGNDAPLTGSYAASETWGVAYKSLDAMRAKYPRPFQDFGTFGNILEDVSYGCSSATPSFKRRECSATPLPLFFPTIASFT
jgi:hypothetical protein